MEETLGVEAGSISRAIQSAFDILGPISKQRLFSYLKENYDVDIWIVDVSALTEIKYAITDLFGESAASLLMKNVYDEIEKVAWH